MSTDQDQRRHKDHDMQRYFMPRSRKKRDLLLYIEVDDEGETFGYYTDSDKVGVSKSFRKGWLEQKVSEGSWVEMPDPPIFSGDDAAAELLVGADTKSHLRIAARLLHAHGCHATAAALEARVANMQDDLR